MRRAFAKLRVALCFTVLSFSAPLTAAHYFQRANEVALELFFLVALRSFRCALVLVGTREGLFLQRFGPAKRKDSGVAMAARTMIHVAANDLRSLDVARGKEMAAVGSYSQVCRVAACNGLHLEEQSGRGRLVATKPVLIRRRGVACCVRASVVPVSNGAPTTAKTGKKQEE